MLFYDIDIIKIVKCCGEVNKGEVFDLTRFFSRKFMIIQYSTEYLQFFIKLAIILKQKVFKNFEFFE